MLGFEESYVLGTKNNKPMLSQALNDKSKEICFDLHYLLQYYNIDAKLEDRSNVACVKICVIKSIHERISYYLNNDEEGSIDIVNHQGLFRDMSYEDSLKLVVEQFTK